MTPIWQCSGVVTIVADGLRMRIPARNSGERRGKLTPTERPRKQVLRGTLARWSDDTDARNVVQKLLDAASSGPLVSAWWEHRLVAWHSPIPKRSGASRAVQVRAGRRLRR